MTQKQRTLAAMGAVGLLAGGLILYVVRLDKHDTAEKAEKDKVAQLFTFDRAQVTGMSVTAKGQTTELSKEGAHWVLTSPVKTGADQNVVDALLSRMGSLRTRQTIEAHAADLAPYGLDHAEAHVVLRLQDGKTDELTLGAINEFNNTQYVTKGGSDAVYLAEGGNAPTLERTTYDLRDKRVAPFDTADVSQIAVEAPGGARYTIARDGAGWKVTAPRELRADPVAVAKVLGAVQNLRANAIATEDASDLSKYGLDKPMAKATVTFKNGKSSTVLFGQSEDQGVKKLYAKREDAGLIAQVPLDAPAGLAQTLDALEDKDVVHFDKDQVAALSFATPDGQTVLVQRKRERPIDGGFVSEVWTQLSPKPGIAKRWKLNSLLHALNTLQATKVDAEDGTDLAKYGLDKPKRKATVLDDSGKTLAEIWVGNETGESVYVKSAADPRVFELPTKRVSDFPNGADDLLMPPTTATAKP